ncbi:MAG TPA: YbhB/YbcL family Raf kinase inhibitor-like protein [Steroidobacteraceae bacterium]|jgi:Raf kinase inhibitor-like YbhB/YbcL family protein|nr:YbhB/YbcL family Raf kinase inhibitor-like protein [Steroidobacteraceae bacterium]
MKNESHRLPRWAIAALAAVILPIAMMRSQTARAQQGDGTDVAISTVVWKPAKVAADAAHIAHLKVPTGFTVKVFARDLENSRVIAVAPNGDVYVSRRDQGDVLLLKDRDSDGKADASPVAIAHRAGAHGLAIHDGKLYLITVKEIFVADVKPDGTLGDLALFLGDLPDGGQHGNRTIAFGPDGKLYISAGSTCNACNESNPESATILQVSPDGKSRAIFAGGLRNTIGFDWHPGTGELWGFDNGIDFLGNDQQPEELNHIVRGKQYGWPHVFGRGDLNPQSTPPGGITKEQWREQSEPMTMGYTAHAAPMQLLFYRGGSFPKEYFGDAFVTFRGSWNRKPASGYEVVRVQFTNGEPQSIEPFLTGFLSDGGRTHFARPMGLAQAKDGSLLVADDANGFIYRIAYEGGGASAAAGQAPAKAMEAQMKQGMNVPLAIQRSETRATGKLMVESSTIRGVIPKRHSEYADGVSPQISWSKVGAAKSYTLIVEDPDAQAGKPFVHWVAYDIPAEVTTLPEGLQEQARLTEPEGLLQGRTTRGSVGYLGPRPPVGDPPHHYHFQVFALDSMLDVPPGAERDVVLTAMKGHVLASGELVGTYQQTVAPPK